MRIGQILDGFMIIVSIAQGDAHLRVARQKVNNMQWRRTQKTTTPHVTTILGEVDYVVSILLSIPPHTNILYAI